jgi:Domain of unknown function (DUF4188)
MTVDRQTVDLSAYPDLVVFYLGIRVRRPRGMLRLFGLEPQIQKSWKEQPDGLLLHEDFIWSLIPPHAGMRQYWRDLDSLERWSHSEPHKLWWQQYLRDSGGTGLWHETYFMGGGIEAIYDDMNRPIGLARFAPVRPARGAMFSARRRAGRSEPSTVGPRTAAAPGQAAPRPATGARCTTSTAGSKTTDLPTSPNSPWPAGPTTASSKKAAGLRENEKTVATNGFRHRTSTLGSHG